ncbi:MAG: sigma 54-interacting transcriptional regulator [Desulfobacteraceae bacterium]|jgi:transcriptional regulator with PAS, ATPase and Fis domain
MLNLLECTPIAQFAIGLDHRVVVWNKACELLTGVPARKMIGTDHQWEPFYEHKRPVLADLIIEQDYEKFLEIYEGKNPSKSEIVPHAWEATDFFENTNGKARYIYFLAAPVFDKGGNMTGAVTTLQDITQQKLWEINMRKESEWLQKQNILLRSSMKERFRFCDIIGKSKKMQDVYDLILKAASSSDNVIIVGESGVGKELVARAIHDMSGRKEQQFVTVNCGAIPETLLETEFFGHTKGAFTGAHAAKKGFLDKANGGTLFLDEVGELSLGMQVKLLRAIEGGGYSQVGSNEVIHSDFRIVAATHRNLIEEVSLGRFREDFFYRIYVIPVVIPTLRERKEDLVLLVDHFLQKLGSDLSIDSIPGRDIEAFYNYNWPGNVRELQNVLRRYVTLKQVDFTGGGRKPPSEISEGEAELVSDSASLNDAVETFEKKLIVKTLEMNRWHRMNAARSLGVSRRTLFRKMERYGLESAQNES